jgi:hypothetical protein
MPPIDKDKFVVVNSGTFARITAKDTKDIEPLYHSLRNAKHDNYKIYLAKDFPKGCTSAHAKISHDVLAT